MDMCYVTKPMLLVPVLAQNVVVSFFNSPHCALSIYLKTVMHTHRKTLSPHSQHTQQPNTSSERNENIFKFLSAHGQVAEQQNETIEIAKSKGNKYISEVDEV